MQQGQSFFRLTAKGRELWARRANVALPVDYRRILGLVERTGYSDVIRSHLARFPRVVVDGWLEEFEQLHLIESISIPQSGAPALSRKALAIPLDDEDVQDFEQEATLADISLSRLGVYVSARRVTNLSPSAKLPIDTLALVVEDDPDQLALALRRLTTAGYPTQSADCVQALFETLGRRTPDAMFLDVELPDGNGFDVLTTLRQHPSFALLPIVMLTAKTEPEDIAKGLALGADGYVTKPYGRNTLDYVLRYVMKHELDHSRL